MAGKTMLITDLECDSSEVEQELQQQEEVVIELKGRLSRELNGLLNQNLDGNHWAESNQIAASAAAAIMTGKRPRQYSEEDEEEHSVIDIEDDDDEEKRMVCRDLGDEIIVLSDSEDEEDDVQPMDQDEQSPSLFKYDPQAEALHFTGVLPNYYDLAAKPSNQELDLLLPENNAPLDLWGEEPLLV
jgi:hypothetical protein